MNRKSELFYKALREVIVHGGYVGARLLSALEGGFVRAIEDENGVYRERNEAETAIVECARCRICPPFACLDLK